jgi:hypothetical protein
MTRYWQGGWVPSEQITLDPGGTTTVLVRDGEEPLPVLELHAVNANRPSPATTIRR